jgi:hypothetical protein
MAQIRLRDRLVNLARSEEHEADISALWIEAMPHAWRANLVRQLLDKLDFRGTAYGMGWLGGRVVMTAAAEHDWWAGLAVIVKEEAYREDGLPRLEMWTW